MSSTTDNPTIKEVFSSEDELENVVRAKVTLLNTEGKATGTTKTSGSKQQGEYESKTGGGDNNNNNNGEEEEDDEEEEDEEEDEEETFDGPVFTVISRPASDSSGIGFMELKGQEQGIFSPLSFCCIILKGIIQLC
jgi:hypothetical protein